MKKTEERLFDVHLTARESLLGHLLVILDGKYDVTSCRLIKEVPEGRNNQRGMIKEMVLELIKKAGGKMPLVEIRRELIAAGYTKGSAYTAVIRLIKSNLVTKGKGNVITLKRRAD